MLIPRIKTYIDRPSVTNAHPDPTEYPSILLPPIHLVSNLAVPDQGLEYLSARNLEPPMLDEAAQPPASLNNTIDSGHPPNQITKPDEPHVSINIERLGDTTTQDNEIKGVAGIPTMNGGPQIAIDVGVVDYTEAEERITSKYRSRRESEPEDEDEVRGIGPKK